MSGVTKSCAGVPAPNICVRRTKHILVPCEGAGGKPVRSVIIVIRTNGAGVVRLSGWLSKHIRCVAVYVKGIVLCDSQVASFKPHTGGYTSVTTRKKNSEVAYPALLPHEKACQAPGDCHICLERFVYSLPWLSICLYRLGHQGSLQVMPPSLHAEYPVPFLMRLSVYFCLMWMCGVHSSLCVQLCSHRLFWNTEGMHTSAVVAAARVNRKDLVMKGWEFCFDRNKQTLTFQSLLSQGSVVSRGGHVLQNINYSETVTSKQVGNEIQ